eukprot:353211-Chlamydomonas_euryale.AAC.5
MLCSFETRVNLLYESGCRMPDFDIGQLPLPAWSSDSRQPAQWAAAVASFPLGYFDPAQCEPGFPPLSGCGQAPAAAASALSA